MVGAEVKDAAIRAERFGKLGLYDSADRERVGRENEKNEAQKEIVSGVERRKNTARDATWP